MYFCEVIIYFPESELGLGTTFRIELPWHNLIRTETPLLPLILFSAPSYTRAQRQISYTDVKKSILFAGDNLIYYICIIISLQRWSQPSRTPYNHYDKQIFVLSVSFYSPSRFSIRRLFFRAL